MSWVGNVGTGQKTSAQLQMTWGCCMGLYVGSTVINTTDVEKGIAFWTAALGYVVVARTLRSPC